MTESDTLKKALFTIQKLKKKIAEQPQTHVKPIAIIGIGCRFPQAKNKNEFWDRLCEGKNSISSFPKERLDLLKNTPEDIHEEQVMPIRGGFLSEISDFDAYFFGITPREAMRMDPQQRILLEVAYEAIEDAGIPLEKLAGSNTGVFMSLYASQFAYLQSFYPEEDALYIPTGNAVSMASNRLSYLFDLRGPSLVFDTACSSSLIALHEATLHLQHHLCDLALVGGVNLNLLPSLNVLLAKAKMLSPTGQCHTFDAAADGYVQGEGAGVIVLKPLGKAIKDNDRVYAVLSGGAINQDGKTNGLTAPNGLQQEALLRAAYRSANMACEAVDYVECHGTGTFLGDPIEVEALGNVIGKTRSAHHPCWIGSVKTNIGHLEPAAGIASVIKMALALYHATLPPHLNFKTPNPHIAFDRYHFKVPEKTMSWPKQGACRVGGVSGFGFGGMNAHMVLRECLEEERGHWEENAPNEAEEALFTLSAKKPEALKELVEEWCEVLEKNKTLTLHRICYNVQVRRSHYFFRLSIISRSIEELKQHLIKIKNDNWEELASAHPVFVNFKNEKINRPVCVSLLAQQAISYVNREPLDWEKLQQGRKFSPIEMPGYPWQRVTYWPFMKNKRVLPENPSHPFKGRHILSPLKTVQFEFEFSLEENPEIKDTFQFLHIGYYLEMISMAVKKSMGQEFFQVEDFIFKIPIHVLDHTVKKVYLILEEKNDCYDIAFYTNESSQKWIQHATGTLSLAFCENKKMELNDLVLDRYLETGTEEQFYDRVARMNMPTTGSIRWVKQYGKEKDKMACALSAPAALPPSGNLNLKMPLGILDCCVQTLLVLLPDDLQKPHVASRFKKWVYYGDKGKPCYTISGRKHFYLTNERGEVIIECQELLLTQLNENIRLDNRPVSSFFENAFLSVPFEDSRLKIKEYLVEQVANLFSMPKNDIALHEPLSHYGIDSLMAMAFSTNIATDLKVNMTASWIQEGATIEEMVNEVMAQLPKKNHRSNPWISYRETKGNPAIRLFCFPYGGGGASIYSGWQKQLPDSIEVCPVQLPGREGRIKEAPLGRFDELIECLVHYLEPEFASPFAFFGHSFGSLIAFELTRQLRARNLPMPCHLFASAFPDPRMPTSSLNNLISELSRINVNLFDLMDAKVLTSLGEETWMNLAAIFRKNGLVEYGQLAMNKDVIKMILPIFIADMSIVKSYRYEEGAPLDVPMTVFLGKKDNWVSYADHFGWSFHTEKACEFCAFDSGHLFIKEEAIKQEMLRKISSILYEAK